MVGAETHVVNQFKGAFMFTPKIILVDQDGVLADYPNWFLKMWREAHPEKPWVPVLALSEHDTVKNYPPEYRKLLEAIDLACGFYRSLPIIPGAKEALENLLSLGHDVRICTAPKRRFTYCVPEKFEWIAEHLGQKWVERTILTRDKTLVHGDILVDDKPEITGIRKPTWKHVLYDQPYNRRFTAKPRITWANYEHLLKELV